MKTIILNQQSVNYELKRNLRSRSLRLSITGSGLIKITMPYLLPEKVAIDFMQAKATWILKKLASRKNTLPLGVDRSKYLHQKNQARKIITERLEYFNRFYNFTYRKVAIRNQATRWGSCSRLGNLNYNFQIINLAPNLTDYVIVHELCHLVEFNHSPRFWALVVKTVPNYLQLRKRLKGLE